MGEISNIVGAVVAGVSVTFAMVSLVGAMRAGVLTRLRIGNCVDLHASPKEREEATAMLHAAGLNDADIPFETKQLALYYGQILSQSKISFWFSLIFAALGFGVIIVAVFMFTGASVGTTVAQFAAGLVMDAVASLFFVQSRNAQKSMGEFFEKLRRDRQQLEARKLCEALEEVTARDAVRIQLAMHHAEVPNAAEVAKTVINAALLKGRPVDEAGRTKEGQST